MAGPEQLDYLMHQQERDAAEATPLLPIYKQAAQLRHAGATWDQIDTAFRTKRAEIISAGGTHEQVDKAFGYDASMPGALYDAIKTDARQQIQAGDKTSAWGHLWNGVKTSTLGIGTGIAPTTMEGYEEATKPAASRLGRVSQAIGTAIGETPEFVGIAGTAAATGVGAIPGAAAAFAIPAMQRRAYIHDLQQGRVKNGSEWLSNTVAIGKEGLEGAAEGAAMGAAGAVGGRMGKMVSPFAEKIGTALGETTGLATSQAAIAGHMPTMADFTDTAIMVASFHGAGAAMRAITPENQAATRDRAIANLQDWYARTGEDPKVAWDRAQKDPFFMQKLLQTPKPIIPHPVDDHAHTPDGDLITPHDPAPAGSGHAHGDTFDTALPYILKNEGTSPRVVVDSGGATIYGISKNAHPEAWANGTPTMSDAVRIYKHDYWDKLNIDSLDPSIRLTVFDAAVNEGPGKAREMLAASGGDVDVFNKLRHQHYDSLIASNPEKYQRYANSWNHRFSVIEGNEPSHPDYGATPHPMGEFKPENHWLEFDQKPLEDRQDTFEDQRAQLRDEDGTLPSEFKEVDHALAEATDPVFNVERATEAVKWADENGRADIAKALVDRAQTEADKAREEAGPAMPGGEKPQAAAFAELQALADQKQKDAEAIAKLAGIDPSPKNLRPIPTEPTQHQKDASHPLVRAAQTGDKMIDGVINSPVTANVIANAKVNKEYDTPWTASGSVPLSDPTIYIGRNVPDYLTTKSGKVFPTSEPLIIHENVEQHIMEALIKAGVSKEEAYQYAHWNGGERAEHAWYRAHGIDPAEAEEAWKPVIEAGLQNKGTDYPPNPYRDTGQFAKDAHSSHDASEPKPSAALIARAEAILKPDETTGAIELGRKAKGSGKGKVTPEDPYQVAGADPWGDMLQLIDRSNVPDVSTFQKLTKWASSVYYDYFSNSSPIQKMRDAAMARRGQDGVSPIQAVNDPVFLTKLADAAAESHGLYMLNYGMVEAQRDPATGAFIPEWKENGVPSFVQTWGKHSFSSSAEYDRFSAYTVARLLVQLDKQGLKVPGNVESAKLVMAQEEARGNNPEPVATLVPRLWKMAADMKVPIHLYDLLKDNSPIADQVRGSAFYRAHAPGGTELGSIHIEDPRTTNFRAKYGSDSPFELVLAHEMGHAIAHAEGGFETAMQGIPAARRTLMADQIYIASLRYKPATWDAARGNTNKASLRYFEHPRELLADSIALAVVDPEARPYLTELYRAVPGLEKYAKIYPREELGTPVTRRFRDAVDYRNGTLRYSRDTGLVSQDNFLQWMAKKEAAIPGYRSQADLAMKAISEGHVVPEQGDRIGRGAGKLSYNPFYRAKGDDSLRFQRIEKSLAQDTMLRTKLGQNNLRNTAVVDMAIREGIAEKMPHQLMHFTMEDIEKGPDKKNNVNADSDQLLWRFIPRKAGKDEIPIVRDGKIEIYKVADDAMVRYLKGYDSMRLGAVGQAMTSVSRFYRNNIVLAPTFGPRNAAMDAVWQPLVKDVTLREHLNVYYRGIPEVLKHYTGKGDDTIYRNYLLSAGAEKVFENVHNDPYLRELMQTGGDPALGTLPVGSRWRAVQRLQTWTRMWMDVPKVGRYASLIEQGETALQAGVKAQQYAFHSPSFGGPASQISNMLHPFFQAHLNGMEQLLRSALGQQASSIPVIRDFLNLEPGMANRRPDGSLYMAPKFYTHAAMMITLPFLANWWMNKDQQWYKDMPDWQKFNGLAFDGFGLLGHPIYIKFPPVAAYLFGGLPVMLAEKMYREHGPTGWDAIKGLAGAFMPWAPGMVAAVSMPFLEHQLNKSVQWDRPLVTDRMAENLPNEQANPWNSEVSKQLAKVANYALPNSHQLAPAIVDNYIRQWGGPLGQAGVAIVDGALHAAGVGKPSELPSDVSNWPIVGSMFAKDRGEFTGPVQQYLDRYKAYEQVHGSLVTAMQQDDLPRFKQLLGSNPLEASMHSTHLREEGKMMMQGVDTRPFQQALQEVAQRITPQAQADFNTIMMGHKAIRYAMDQVAAFNAGKDVRDPPEAASGPLKLTGTDRVQLIRQRYRAIQVTTDAILTAMDRSGWR